MGLLGRLTGWDQQKEAHNAVLANHLAETASLELRQEIAKRLVIIQKQVRGGEAGGTEKILRELSKEVRIVQMNFVALACNSLGFPSSLKGIAFAEVQNPYRANNFSALDRIGVAINDLSRRSGRRLNWPGNDVHVDFLQWYGSSSTSDGANRENNSVAEIDLEVATALAYNALLLQSIDRNLVRTVVVEIYDKLNDQSTFTFSNHDLAVISALQFYNHHDLRHSLKSAQMMARLQAVGWLEAGDLSRDALELFEDELYNLYKS